MSYPNLGDQTDSTLTCLVCPRHRRSYRLEFPVEEAELARQLMADHLEKEHSVWDLIVLWWLLRRQRPAGSTADR